MSGTLIKMLAIKLKMLVTPHKMLAAAHIMSTATIGVAAIGAMGTKAPPDNERNLSIRNQKVLKY